MTTGYALHIFQVGQRILRINWILDRWEYFSLKKCQEILISSPIYQLSLIIDYHSSFDQRHSQAKLLDPRLRAHKLLCLRQSILRHTTPSSLQRLRTWCLSGLLTASQTSASKRMGQSRARL